MKFILILLLSIWLTSNSPIKKESEAIQLKRRLYQGNYTESDCPEQIMIYEGLEKKSTLGYFNFMRTIPLCNWDCSYYKMIAERGVPDNQIAMAEPYTQVFTYLDSYNGETNSDEGAISVNSIIACAFWVGTGIPTYIAFLIFCLGNDVDYSQRNSQEENQSTKTKTVVKTQAYMESNQLQQKGSYKNVTVQASQVKQTTQKNRDSQQIILEQTQEDQAQQRKLNQPDQSSKVQQQQQVTYVQQSQNFSQSSAQRSGQRNDQLYEIDLQQNQQQVKTSQQQQNQQQGLNTYQQSGQYQVQSTTQQSNQQQTQHFAQQQYQQQVQTSNLQYIQSSTQQSQQHQVQVSSQQKSHQYELQAQVEQEKSDDTEMEYKVQAQQLSNTFFIAPAKK